MNKEQFERLINKPENKLHITLSDRILNELNIIESIFKAQLFVKSEKIHALPYLLNYDGHSEINGKYICSMDVFSNIELLYLQKYKEELRIRYENTNNHSLLQNELIEIREKALSILDYYKENLSNKSKIVIEYKEKLKNLDSLQKYNESMEFSERHHAIIVIVNYDIFYIRLECDRTHHSPTLITHNFAFNYLSDNNTFALFCQKLIDFIDKFDLKKTNSNDANYNDLHKELINGYIENISIADFIEIMKFKHLPNGSKKIHWKGYKADGIRFADYFNFEIKQLNNCFYHEKGLFHDKNREKVEKGSKLTDILKKY